MNSLRMFALASAVCILSVPAGLAQVDEGLPTKGQVTLTGQDIKMEKGKTYAIVVEGKGFRPVVVVNPGAKGQEFATGEGSKAEIYFTAPESRSYKVYVSGVPLDAKADGQQSYSISVKESASKVGLVLKKRVDIDANDPPYAKRNNFPHKAFKLQMQQGMTYEIDLTEVDQIDPYLFLEDAQGTVLAQNDDFGGTLNSKIIFSPQKTGQYTIIATTFSGGEGELELKVNAERGVRQGVQPGRPNPPDFNNFPGGAPGGGAGGNGGIVPPGKVLPPIAVPGPVPAPAPVNPGIMIRPIRGPVQVVPPVAPLPVERN